MQEDPYSQKYKDRQFCIVLCCVIIISLGLCWATKKEPVKKKPETTVIIKNYITVPKTEEKVVFKTISSVMKEKKEVKSEK